MKIVYKELSSIEADLGYSAHMLYALSNSIAKHYRSVSIPKHDGTSRTLSIPDAPLKAVQRRIASVILPLLPISQYATAYRCRGGIVANASPHRGKDKILKLDIYRFFDSIMYSAVKDRVFTRDRFSEPIRVLLSILCYYDDRLPQGAPTSPAISNIIMREFDDAVGKWCSRRGITYTRYCDDMTFSGDFNAARVVAFVRRRLKKYGFLLNDKKTHVARYFNKQVVTGIVVNRKLNVPSSYRRKIRQEMYFCRKHGIEEHLKFIHDPTPPQEYIRRLLGRVGYVLSVSPDDGEFRKYRDFLRRALAQESE
ncbi:MAG: RNA-directed DNA polymerase [Clostridia bacterium]|nr:RNA-directed DNA polymerase [Clostridia bacterium]